MYHTEKPKSHLFPLLLMLLLPILIVSLSVRQIYTSRAANFSSFEAETGVIAGNVIVLDDPSASNGKAVVLGVTAVPLRTLYVSPSGSDTNSGTSSSPFKTIAKAISLLQAGDLLYVRAGTYPVVTIQGKAGTANAPIAIKAYPGEKVILTNNTVSSGYGFNVHNASYLTIDGFEITNTQKGILVFNSHYVTLQNNFIHDIGMEAISQKDKSDFGKILNNEIHRTGLYNSDYAEGIYIGNGAYPGAHNIAYPDTTHDILVKGNRVYNDGQKSGEGINIKGESYNITVEDNIIHDMSVSTGGGISIDAITPNPDGSGLWQPNVDRNYIIRNNTVYNITTYSQYGDGNGINDRGLGARIYNNALYNNQHYGVVLSNPGNIIQPIKVYHNTIAFNKGSSDGGGIAWYFTSSLVDIKNNIGSVRSGNMLYTAGLFIDPTNYNFHLISGSAAIDKGSNVGITSDKDGISRPQGSGYDMGAYEFK